MSDEDKHLASIIDAGFEVEARKALAKRLKPIMDEILEQTITDLFGDLKGLVRTERGYGREGLVKVLLEDRRKPKT